MEAQGGGEVRRLHIVYFLSRKGRIEHPHLIRVHHLSRNGVRLRDVKRWLSELRGKDMPESYAWSCKRRYKTDFVWQDLLDEDLITPISDNEYVLKGSSEISSTTFDIDLTSIAEKEYRPHKEPHSVEAKTPQVIQKPSYNQRTIQEHLETPMDNMLTKPLLEIAEESPPFSSETSTQTDDSLKLEEENQSEARKEEEEEEENQREKCDSAPFCSTFLNKKKKKKINGNDFKAEEPRGVIPDSSPLKSTFTKSRSYSNNASNMFRNLITCGGVDTNDSGMVMINRRSTSKGGSKLDMATYKPTSGNKMSEICRGEIVGGSSERISWNQQQQNAGRKSWDGTNGSKNKKSDMNSQKPVPPPYKPVNGPNCAQCGKTFKPEKLHAHMKSCRGMKALARGGATPANSSCYRRSTDSPPWGSISSHYLINK